MLEEYASKIECLFYLKENENLTMSERNVRIQNVLNELRKEAMRVGHRKGVALCKNAIKDLGNANNSEY